MENKTRDSLVAQGTAVCPIRPALMSGVLVPFLQYHACCVKPCPRVLLRVWWLSVPATDRRRGVRSWRFRVSGIRSRRDCHRLGRGEHKNK